MAGAQPFAMAPEYARKVRTNTYVRIGVKSISRLCWRALGRSISAQRSVQDPLAVHAEGIEPERPLHHPTHCKIRDTVRP
eukprot:gene10333-biopygen3488